jgi:hypothetical protein
VKGQALAAFTPSSCAKADDPRIPQPPVMESKGRCVLDTRFFAGMTA